jgi:hypothetical protein
MNQRLLSRRTLQIVAALVVAAPVVYWICAPKRRCRQDLVMQLDRLSVGDYELDIAGDGYANHCEVIMGERGRLSGSCKLSEGVTSVSPDIMHFPVQLAQVKLELRSNREILAAGTFTPVTYRGSNGCTSATIFVQFDKKPAAGPLGEKSR